MASPQVNGDHVPNATHSSAFVQHLLDYPLVNDGVQTFKTNQYGQRSIELSDSAYKTLSGSVLPWLAKPYGYVSPYVAQADTFGDRTLGRLDARFPVVKKPTNELYSDTRGLILLPYHKGLEGRDHLFQIYATEIKKGGDEQQTPGLVAYGRAAITTALVVSNETLGWISSFLTAKKEQTATVVNEKVNQ
jgi:hypothetical protein